MKKELESKGRTESVKVRERHLSDGTISLYLDILHNGKRSREFLKLYLFEGNSREIKERNKLTLAQAPTTIHVISAFYGFNRYKANFRKSFRK